MLDTIKEENYLSPEELAEKFRISLSSVYKLVRSGEIPSVRLGKIYRIPESDLATYLQRQKKKKEGLLSIPEGAKKFLSLLRSSSLKNQINEVYLYGSYARGDYDPDSDIDLFVVVDRLDLKTRNLISSLAEKAMAATDYQDLLSVREESLDSWEMMKRENYPLTQKILQEGIALWKNH